MSHCENIKVGEEFLASYNWPSAYRNCGQDRCYCSRCYSSKEPDTLLVGGFKYVIPREWTRFGVRVDEPFCNHHDVWKTWANCFHGTSIHSAISIVEHRQLLLPKDVTMDGKKLQIREGHIPGEYFFFTTPTIKYAALDCYAYAYDFKSPSNKKQYKIKVALQCKQKPGSFKIQPETVGARQTNLAICTHISNDEMEWKTQHRATIMPYGLMLHIRKIGDEDPDESDSTKTVDCPHCKQTNIWRDGGYKEGEIVTCAYDNCKRKFQQVTCTYCLLSVVWKNADYKVGSVIICPYENCKKKFQQLSCAHCSNSIVWKNADHKEGSVITCPNETCKKKFQQLSCAHCFRPIIWQNADYKEGSVITCPNETCKKKFQQLSCAHCSNSIVWKNADHKEGSVITCPNETCKKKFQQLSCAHCFRPIIWKNADHKEESIITCPYENCKKQFQQINCAHCSRSIIWKNADYTAGRITTCPYESCKKTFQQLSCFHCSRTMAWKDANYKPETAVTCPYEGCKKTFGKN